MQVDQVLTSPTNRSSSRTLRRILRHGTALKDRVKDDIEQRRFAADDVNMETYNGLLVEALVILPEDPVLSRLPPLPDSVLQAFRFFGDVPPPDFASQRIVSHLSTFLNRLEQILDIDDPAVTDIDEGRSSVGFDASVLQVFIASPSDVQDERDAARDVIHDWNSAHSFDIKTVLLPVLWETHATPEMGDRPQGIINKQLVSSCDLLVGVFWTKLGTPTGVAESGTVEEILAVREAGKPVLLYFSAVPVRPESISGEDYARLTAFKAKCYDEGLVSSYDTIDEFKNILNRHLLEHVRRLRRSSQDSVDTTRLNDTSTDVEAVRVRERLSAFASKLEAEWNSERDSSPFSADGGKQILSWAVQELVDLRSLPTISATPSMRESIDGLLRDLKALQRHRLSIDGGKSFREFWELGNVLVDRVTAVTNEIPAKST